MLAPASNRGSSSGLIRNWQMTASCMMGAKAERQTPWPRWSAWLACKWLYANVERQVLAMASSCRQRLILSRNGFISRDGDPFAAKARPGEAKARQRNGLKTLMLRAPNRRVSCHASLQSRYS